MDQLLERCCWEDYDDGCGWVGRYKYLPIPRSTLLFTTYTTVSPCVLKICVDYAMEIWKLLSGRG
jgi:hypothetical protein